MAEKLTEPNDYFVTEVDGVQTVVYVDDINFLRGDSPEIVHEGNLEFTIYGIGNGQVPSYRMVTTVDGEFATVTSTSTCTFDSCVRGMDLDIDFSSNPKTVSNGEYTEVSGEGSFYNEPLLITWGDSRVEPDDWEEALETPDYKASVEQGINASYCAGDTASAKIRLENKVVAGDVSATLQVANQVTGDVKQIDVTVPPEGTTETVEVSIPDGVNADNTAIMYVGVGEDGERVYQDNAKVGASNSEVTISNVQIPDSVMGGEEYSGSLDVGNESDCDVNVSVSYTSQ